MSVEIGTFHSRLGDNEVRKSLEVRLPLFRAVPGLPKHYARGSVMGETSSSSSRAVLPAYRAPELAKTTPSVYEVKGEGARGNAGAALSAPRSPTSASQ